MSLYCFQNNIRWKHFHVIILNVCFPVIGTSGKVFLPICSRCWTCAWRSLNKGSSARSMCMWVLPCWSGNIRGSISWPDQMTATHSAAEEEAEWAPRKMLNLTPVLNRFRHSVLMDLQDFHVLWGPVFCLASFWSAVILYLKSSGWGSAILSTITLGMLFN